jgi:predicted metalloenzyme YecM
VSSLLYPSVFLRWSRKLVSTESPHRKDYPNNTWSVAKITQIKSAHTHELLGNSRSTCNTKLWFEQVIMCSASLSSCSNARYCWPVLSIDDACVEVEQSAS